MLNTTKKYTKQEQNQWDFATTTRTNKQQLTVPCYRKNRQRVTNSILSLLCRQRTFNNTLLLPQEPAKKITNATNILTKDNFYQ